MKKFLYISLFLLIGFLANISVIHANTVLFEEVGRYRLATAGSFLVDNQLNYLQYFKSNWDEIKGNVTATNMSGADLLFTGTIKKAYFMVYRESQTIVNPNWRYAIVTPQNNVHVYTLRTDGVISNIGDRWNGYIDITEVVAQDGPGTYYVSSLDPGGFYAAAASIDVWTMVAAYEDESIPLSYAYLDYYGQIIEPPTPQTIYFPSDLVARQKLQFVGMIGSGSAGEPDRADALLDDNGVSSLFTLYDRGDGYFTGREEDDFSKGTIISGNYLGKGVVQSNDHSIDLWNETLPMTYFGDSTFVGFRKTQVSGADILMYLGLSIEAEIPDLNIETDLDLVDFKTFKTDVTITNVSSYPSCYTDITVTIPKEFDMTTIKNVKMDPDGKATYVVKEDTHEIFISSPLKFPPTTTFKFSYEADVFTNDDEDIDLDLKTTATINYYPAKNGTCNPTLLNKPVLRTTKEASDEVIITIEESGDPTFELPEPEIKNPQTGDNIVSSIVITTILLTLISLILIKLKRLAKQH